MRWKQSGYTLVELMVTIVVLSILILGSFDLFSSLLHSAIVSQRQAVASTLATNQMEYIKSLPYDNLAVAGGAIVSTNTIPATIYQKVQGTTYTITSSITYADDAYDGCGSYPTLALKQQYCRNYPAPAGAPATDTNPADYKDIHVTVKDKSGLQLDSLDTHVSALVAETASNTGALFVKIIDDSGQPVTGATVNVTNASTTPAVNVTDSTDENGIVILYDLPPSSTNYKYQINASNTGYSSLSTIIPNGALQPTYSSQNLIAQSSSYVTLTLKPMGTNSLIVETTDLNGTALPNAKIYIKGGYKKYSSSSDTSYYYDNFSPTDVRPTTDANGLTGLTNLVPGSYFFCGDLGDTNCKVGNTTYYVAAAVPYGGTSALQPINVPIYDTSSPPTTTFGYNGVSYLQKVRLMLTTNSSFPRVTSISPSDLSLAAGNLNSFNFTISGNNLPCSAVASSCTTKVNLVQGSNNIAASCTGTASGLLLNCTADMSDFVAGDVQLTIKSGSNTLTLPVTPLLGGLVVKP